MHSIKDNGKHKLKAFSCHFTKAHIVIVVMALLVVAAGALFVRSLGRQLYEQRAYSLSQTSEKIVQIMNNVIDNEWERLLYVSHELSREPQATREQLLERLSGFYNMETQLHSWRLSCIDSEGNLYRWDGRIDRWTAPDMLIGSHSNYQITILDARDSDEEQMVFIYCLPEPIVLTAENVRLTHTLLTLDMATFGEALEVSAFDGSSYSYITEQNGTRIYHQQNQNEFIAAYNILTAMQKFDFMYDESYGKLIASSVDDVPYTAGIERDGRRYFVSYASLSVNNWSLFLFVPEENVGGNTEHFVKLLLLQIGTIALILILMIFVFVRTNARQTLARQQIAVDEAHRANMAKSDFLSHMSHDIRTPLNGITGMCHIAEQRLGDDEAVADCLKKIDLSSRQLMALINDVLDMSRIERDKVEINRVPLDLNNLIRTCAVYVEVTVHENGITFEQDTAGIFHPFVFADPVLIEKILTNILSNAVKFTPSGGRIRLSVSDTGIKSGQGLYRFEVEDNGIGIKPEFLEHLFEPFTQENVGSRTKYQGTGLGLSIVKSLVEKLGGSISVRSSVGEGSTFTVNLPLDYTDAANIPTNSELLKPFDGTGLRVLLVEDNELNCLIAKTILEECKLKVDTAPNGAVAVERFRSSAPGEYAIILMDVRMPVMDGLEASRCIRALDRSDAAVVPIVALTADAFAGDMEKTRLAGMNEHLGKPIDVEKLYTVLRRYCSAAKKDGEPQL